MLIFLNFKQLKELVDRRVNIITSAESLLNRFFPDDDNYSRTIKELQSIRKLQVFILWIEMNSPYCYVLVIIGEVSNLGNLFSSEEFFVA